VAFNYNLLANDVAEIIFWQDYQGQTILTVLHYKLVATTTFPDGIAELTALRDHLTTPADPNQILDSLMDCQVADLSHVYQTVQLVYPLRRPVLSGGTTGPGNQANPGMPSNVAGVVIKQSSVAGRGRAGSLHVGGIARADISGGMVSAGLGTRLETLAGRLTLDVPTTGGVAEVWEPVIWNARTPSSTASIAGAYAQDTARVMRRRTLRVGI